MEYGFCASVPLANRDRNEIESANVMAQQMDLFSLIASSLNIFSLDSIHLNFLNFCFSFTGANMSNAVTVSHRHKMHFRSPYCNCLPYYERFAIAHLVCCTIRACSQVVFIVHDFGPHRSTTDFFISALKMHRNKNHTIIMQTQTTKFGFFIMYFILTLAFV